MRVLGMFVSLQVLDLLTTLLGMRFGAQEASPFVRWLMQIGPVEGLVVAKAGAFALAGICLWARRQRVILWINYWYAALILWNLRIILVATPH